MDSQVQRVVQWRDQKRREGYQQITAWVKADIKHMIEDLAAQQREDLGQVITTAILTLMDTKDKRKPKDPPDYRLLERLIDERLEVKLPALLQQAPSPEALELEALPRLGEHGALPKAVELAARKLRRFTNVHLARDINAEQSQTYRALQQLIKKGKVRKVGVTYLWIEESG